MPSDNDAPPEVEELDSDDLETEELQAEPPGVIDRALTDARG